MKVELQVLVLLVLLIACTPGYNSHYEDQLRENQLREDQLADQLRDNQRNDDLYDELRKEQLDDARLDQLRDDQHYDELYDQLRKDDQLHDQYPDYYNTVREVKSPKINQSPEYICSYNAYNCGNFRTHAEAQKAFESCGGITNDVHDLDRDKDGVACETLS